MLDSTIDRLYREMAELRKQLEVEQEKFDNYHISYRKLVEANRNAGKIRREIRKLQHRITKLKGT